MSITIKPTGVNTVKLKLAGPTTAAEGRWVAAKVNSFVAYYNTILDRRNTNHALKFKATGTELGSPGVEPV